MIIELDAAKWKMVQAAHQIASNLVDSLVAP